MLKIAHRINTIKQLKETPIEYGVEIDIRYENDYLILHHDPFMTGELLEEWLRHYQHQLLILNVKTEGIEEACLSLLEKYNIKNYFFLDLSLPYLVKWTNKGLFQTAVRFSEIEPLDFVLQFVGKTEWVWVDCFTYFPLDYRTYTILKQHFKICLVSPELHGHEHLSIADIKEHTRNMAIDAVCTKKMSSWD